MLRTTPFHERTAPLVRAQQWRRWAGYQVASAYDLNHEREYHAVRGTAALFDVSPLYKYLIEGRDAARLLDRVVPRKVSSAAVGRVLYTPWCDSDGKVVDDGTISRLAPDGFRMTSAEPGYRWLAMNARGMDVRVSDVSESLGALAIQGPASREILALVADGVDLGRLKYFQAAPAKLAGADIWISRTGYTGDLGYELWIPADRALDVWDELMLVGEPRGLIPAGIWALDMVRIEAGLIMLDVDYVPARKAVIAAQKSSPYELGLGWSVALDKETFVGRRALAAERARPPTWSLVGLDVEWTSLERHYADLGLPPRLPNIPWRTSVPLYAGGRQVGYATSGSWSPLLKRLLALAHVEARFAAPGTLLEIEITVEHRHRRAAARVTPTPFYDPPRKKA